MNDRALWLPRALGGLALLAAGTVFVNLLMSNPDSGPRQMEFIPATLHVQKPAVAATVPLFHLLHLRESAPMIRRAAEIGAGAVQFCITLAADVAPDGHVRAIGLQRERVEGERDIYLEPFNPGLGIELQGYYTKAFREASALNYRVAVIIHLNAHNDPSLWRNRYGLDPLERLNGHDYADSVLHPICAALLAALPAGDSIELSLQGEMGRTVFEHPKAWLTLLEAARKNLPGLHAKIGLSFNHEEVAGGADPSRILANRDDLERLWGACDFIGISAYHAVPPGVTASDLAANTALFLDEFKSLGAPLPLGKPIHLVEFGLGGGGLGALGRVEIPAAAAAAAASAPYLGTADPTKNPWQNEELRRLRYRYHEALLGLLGGSVNGHPIAAARLWNAGSWDVIGVESPVFVDQHVKKLIVEHNASLKSVK